jgi:putative hemolysin
MRETFQHLEEGGCLGFFLPVKFLIKITNTASSRQTVGKKWHENYQKTKVPVVPMYFHATNSQMFYNVAKLHLICKR